METKRGRELLMEAVRLAEQARYARHLRQTRKGRVRIGVEVGDLIFSEHACVRLEAAGVGRIEGGSLVYTGAPPPGPPLVLVGEDNPYSAHPFLALYDQPPQSAGGRLRAKILGVSRETYFGMDIYRHDLCAGKWSIAEARRAAMTLRDSYPNNAVFVLLGAKVQQVFGFLPRPSTPFRCVWGPAPGGGTRAVVLLPHPSGRCRIWQEPGAIGQARQALREAAPWLPVGEIEREKTKEGGRGEDQGGGRGEKDKV